MAFWVDEELKRKYPSMWADTYYVYLFKVSVTMSMPLTTNSQANQTHVDSVPITSRSEQQPPVAGVQVSTDPEVTLTWRTLLTCQFCQNSQQRTLSLYRM